MNIEKREYPPYKEDIKREFGYVSFNCLLANLDIIGVRSNRTFEIISVFYRGNIKVGYMYEYKNIPEEEIFKFYNSIPERSNDLKAWAEKLGDKITIIEPPKDNYVFVNDMEVSLVKSKKNNHDKK
ncbi:hypothetical protein [Riemerella anatipestifer]|uniref:hypothetical protein n=1 Tax=Riemerella anatipestifer TaxID=34085 RepID=UPI00208F12E7|nr:hypothetical protein [Riemerella anatipestifer]MCO4304727.1 hypothetical protein [Riemerella anatipestifer]MCO7352069.1 hypothetical protein [Riemerella anatipestifer]MCQ4038884.1 hypothetical protein [Riemerella anatipestifer]MCT6761688.1 hypothetical protein [Riemerella anatipestifer]MCT6764346.1 hypothetical protein [Riemerella anatipestifer]